MGIISGFRVCSLFLFCSHLNYGRRLRDRAVRVRMKRTRPNEWVTLEFRTSQITLHKIHLDIPWKCRFWFRSSGVKLRSAFLTSSNVVPKVNHLRCGLEPQFRSPRPESLFLRSKGQWRDQSVVRGPGLCAGVFFPAPQLTGQVTWPLVSCLPHPATNRSTLFSLKKKYSIYLKRQQ